MKQGLTTDWILPANLRRAAEFLEQVAAPHSIRQQIVSAARSTVENALVGVRSGERHLSGESRQALFDMFKNYAKISFVLALHAHQFYNPPQLLKRPMCRTCLIPPKLGGTTARLCFGQ